MRKNKTYKKAPTKYQRAKKEHDMLFSIVFLVIILNFIICMSIQMIESRKEDDKMAQNENKGINTQLPTQQAQEAPNLAKNDTPSTNYEELSNGIKLIPVKTSFFDAEVNIRLAAEQACKYVGAEKWNGEKQCIEDLVGIAWKETKNFDCKLSGDSGKSKGCFQIHLGYHPDVTIEQAEDPFWAAIWTAKRLISKGYPEYRSYAIMAHNGTPGTKKTLEYLNTVNSIALRD